MISHYEHRFTVFTFYKVFVMQLCSVNCSLQVRIQSYVNAQTKTEYFSIIFISPSLTRFLHNFLYFLSDFC